MRINFFEEFPLAENFEKSKLITFPSTIFVASKSMEDFSVLRKEVEKYNPNVTVAYWPIVENSYYISPFSNTKDLEKLFSHLENNAKGQTVLLDIELPLLKGDRHLFFRNVYYFLKNRRIIKNFIKKSPELDIECVLAEYPRLGFFSEFSYSLLGLTHSDISCRKIIMFYTSMVGPVLLDKMRKHILRMIKKDKNIEIGLGTIAVGILGNEPILSAESLKRDLEFAKENGIGSVTIFRLGGLNKQYMDVINQFL